MSMRRRPNDDTLKDCYMNHAMLIIGTDNDSVGSTDESDDEDLRVDSSSFDDTNGLSDDNNSSISRNESDDEDLSVDSSSFDDNNNSIIGTYESDGDEIMRGDSSSLNDTNLFDVDSSDNDSMGSTSYAVITRARARAKGRRRDRIATNNNSGNSGGKYIYFKFWQKITSRMKEGIVQTAVLKAIEDYQKGNKSVQDLRDLLIEFCTTEKEDNMLYALLPINNAKEDAIDDAWNELWAANADDIEDASMEEEEAKQQEEQQKHVASMMTGSSSAARMAAPASTAPQAIGDTTMTFPQLLHQILSMTEYQAIVHWVDDGRSFIIEDRRRFALEILPKYFKSSLFHTFTRKLNRWGFNRANSRSNFQELMFESKYFIRDDPMLCLRMKCKSREGRGTKKALDAMKKAQEEGAATIGGPAKKRRQSREELQGNTGTGDQQQPVQQNPQQSQQQQLDRNMEIVSSFLEKNSGGGESLQSCRYCQQKFSLSADGLARHEMSCPVNMQVQQLLQQRNELQQQLQRQHNQLQQQFQQQQLNFGSFLPTQLAPSQDTMTEELKQLSARSGASKKYWADSAAKLGHVDTMHGIRLDKDVYLKAKHFEIEASPKGTHETSQAPIVLPTDKRFTTAFTFHLMSQVQPCAFTEADRLGCRRGLEVGYAGLACRHCVGEYGSGRFFPSSVETMSDASKTLDVVYKHMCKCKKCPLRVKNALHELRRFHDSERSKLPFGNQRAFFSKIWSRLHEIPWWWRGRGGGVATQMSRATKERLHKR